MLHIPKCHCSIDIGRLAMVFALRGTVHRIRLRWQPYWPVCDLFISCCS